MTENKRFTVDYDITVGNYCLHDEYEAKGVDGYIAYLSDEERANNLCDLLNEQDNIIKELENYQEVLSKDLSKCADNRIKKQERINELESRNKRQYKRLKKITDLMHERNWERLETMVKDWERWEKQLEQEWGTYCENK